MLVMNRQTDLPLVLHAQAEPLALRLSHERLAARIDLPHGRPRRAPLLALHGISRDANAIRRGFLAETLGSGRVLVTPRFGRKHWPHFQRIGRARPDLAVLELLAQAGRHGDFDTGKFALFGYSGGAQFVHRFAMLYPGRVAALHVAAAGWYCLPDPTVAWPAGLGRAKGPVAPIANLKLAQLDAFLRLPVRLYVGTRDDAREPALRQGRRLDAIQGRTRIERAQNYLLAFANAARQRGIRPDISLTLLPGCGHDFTECAREGGLARLVCAS
ncbi:alpha/beta fold hydrolase [Paracoccus laeviglucosivorans]|uniref:Pimeloyl-ACP methyl ester carboxylesterase n=1 Tax=Paracoccus laeviglucosivorans TaxID=1197861 RepID=A0A521BA45_9RHOB|nr:alpha/beta hydrolase [Paracoccus laeviglucosivorans]SMO43958.1 Pimeloyl-ACP methyl ester carboxylesterase [Paracoccus laeviglucosivorans]